MMPRLELGQTFPTILIARDAINRSVIDNGESYKIHTSNARVYIIQCRDARNSSYSFYIRASLSKKSSVVSIVTLRSSHSYSPHAIVGLRSLGKDPYLLFDRAYTILNYRLTYQQRLLPISMQDIPCFPSLLPPLVVRKRGRPRVRRIRKRERYQDGQRKCGNSWFRQLGHNTGLVILQKTMRVLGRQNQTQSQRRSFRVGRRC
jgi:hypothetical protein